MPSGTGVVDAFKSTSLLAVHHSVHGPIFLVFTTLTVLILDLIRHGKNHTARQHDDQHHQYSSQQQQQPQQQASHQQARDRSREQPREQQQPQTQKTHAPKYQEELEQIVQQEREAKETMPVYKGLENYKLVEKMGECALVTIVGLPSSGANTALSPQRRFLKRLQGHRSSFGTEGCRSAFHQIQHVSTAYPISYSESRSQV